MTRFEPRNGSVALLHQVKKKADVAEPVEGFNHVGLLVNLPPGVARLPFNESSELEFNDSTEPISV